MKRIGFILMLAITMAFLLPAQSMAQQASQSITITGGVYTGALPVEGAKVQLYSWDGNKAGDLLKTVTTSDGTNGPRGTFSINVVLTGMYYDPDRPFNYVVKATKDDGTAYALVHIVPPAAAGQDTIAEPISLDLSMDSWVSDLTGIVESGNLLPTPIGVPNANVTIYARDQTTGEPFPNVYTSTVSNSFGKFEIKNVEYGLYQAVVTANVNGKPYIEKVNLTVYQQQKHFDVVMSGVIMSPPPGSSANPSTGGGGGGFFGLPGFEAVLALAALSGAALYLKKR